MTEERSAPACVFWPTPTGDYKSWEWRSPMAIWQDYRCAFCGTRRDKLVRDHDHSTQIIRGLLCRACNTHEPYAWQDDAWNIYREWGNPSEILGIREVYYPDTLTALDRAIINHVESDPAYQRRLAWAQL